MLKHATAMMLGFMTLGVCSGCLMDARSWDPLLLIPVPGPEESPADIGLTYEEVRIPTSGGRELGAWFIPASQGQARGTVVIHPGLAGNIGMYVPMCSCVLQSGCNLLLYDYQGFGSSEGEASFDTLADDARAVVEYLLSRPEPSARVLAHLGASLGTLPAISVAAEYSDFTVGLILFGGFYPEQIAGAWLGTFISPLLTPLGDWTGHLWAERLPDALLPQKAIPDFDFPVLCIAPKEDIIVPLQVQLRFFESLPEPKELYLTSAPHSPDALQQDPDLCGVIVEWGNRLDGLLGG